MGQHRPVAVVEIGDAVGERRQRDRVGAEEHLAVAIADRERAAAAGADHQVVLALEEDGEREGAAQPVESLGDGLGRRQALVKPCGDQVGDDLGVGLGDELGAGRGQFVLQLAEILDDAVVDQRQPRRRMRMGIALGRRAVGRPAGMADAGAAREGLPGELGLEVAQLAFGAAPRQVSVFQRRDAGRVVAAIFEPLQRIDQKRRHRLPTEDADDPAHALPPNLPLRSHLATVSRRLEIKSCFAADIRHSRAGLRSISPLSLIGGAFAPTQECPGRSAVRSAALQNRDLWAD